MSAHDQHPIHQLGALAAADQARGIQLAESATAPGEHAPNLPVQRGTEDRLRATQEHANIGIAEYDAQGRFLHVNSGITAITGYTRDELLGRSFFEFTDSEDAVAERLAFARHIAGEDSTYTFEKRCFHKDGSVVWLAVSASAVFDSTGQFQFGVRIVQDITARKLAEAEREAILASIADGFAALDPAWRFTYINPAGETLLGRTHGNLIGRTIQEVIPDAIGAEPASTLQRVMAKRIPLTCETFFAPWQRWFEVRAFPAETGGISVYFTDITSRKQAEERQQLLIRELHHRVKNTLATVQGLAGASMRTASSMEAFRTGFTDRLVSLGRTHGLLTENAWEGAALGTLLRLELAPFDDGSEARVRISGPEVRLPAEMAVAFGMVLHELTTNAAKHGSLSVVSGSVEVTWTVETQEGQQHLDLRWIESGGPAVAPPGHGGFGTQLLQRLLRAQMNGTVEIIYAPEGARVALQAVVPLGDEPCL